MTGSARSDPPAWRRWTLAVGVAEAGGIAVAAAIVAGAMALVGNSSSPVAMAVVLGAAALGGAAEGGLVGSVMYRLLSGWLPGLSAFTFVGATVAVAVTFWVVGSLPSALISAAGIAGGVVAGAVFGAAQAAVLQAHVAHPWRWVTANAIGWGIGVPVITVGASIPESPWPLPVLLPYGAGVGLLAGLAVGGATGYALPGLTIEASPARRRRDRVVLEFLRGPAHRLLSGSLVELRYQGPRSGRTHSLPVMYARHGNVLVLMPGHAHRKRWWRAFGERIPVTVILAGQELAGQAILTRVGRPGYATALQAWRERFPWAEPGPMDPFVVVDLAGLHERTRLQT